MNPPITTTKSAPSTINHQLSTPSPFLPIWQRFKSRLRIVTNGDLKKLLIHIMSTQAEAAAILADVLAQQKKTAGEIQAVQAASTVLATRITELEAIVAAGNVVGPELEAAIAAVKEQAQITDDLIPDVVVTPSTEPA